MKVKFLLSPIAYEIEEKLEEAKNFLGKYLRLEESENPDAIILLTGGTEEESIKYLEEDNALAEKNMGYVKGKENIKR